MPRGAPKATGALELSELRSSVVSANVHSGDRSEDAAYFARLEAAAERAERAEREKKEAAEKADREAVSAAEQAKIQADLDEQTRLKRLTLVPFPAEVTARVLPFRSPLSIEHSTIFASNDFKGDSRIIVLDPETRARVLIGQVDDQDRARGVLVQRHQDVFYKLLVLWQEQGYRLGDYGGTEYGVLVSTPHKIVMAVCGDDAEHHYKRARRLITDLQSIPIVFERVRTWQGTRDRIQFTLLGGLQWDERNVDKVTGLPRPGGKSEVSIMFSPFVTDSFKRKNVKQLLAEPYYRLGGARFGPRAEIARLLYPFLDAQLSTKPEYHAKLDALAERFGLRRYKYKSDRRRKFELAVKMLDGKPILGERFELSVLLEEASDGTDYVLIARRVEPVQRSLFPK